MASCAPKPAIPPIDDTAPYVGHFVPYGDGYRLESGTGGDVEQAPSGYVIWENTTDDRFLFDLTGAPFVTTDKLPATFILGPKGNAARQVQSTASEGSCTTYTVWWSPPTGPPDWQLVGGVAPTCPEGAMDTRPKIIVQ